MIVASAIELNEVARVVFENDENNQPDLYITKHVESIDERYEAPKDDEFSFTLKLDGNLVNELIYRVFDENGDEVYQYVDPDDSAKIIESTEDKSNKIPYQTNRFGNFTLKSGQTAFFEYVGVGKNYEVTEDPKEGYHQTLPAGGAAATGTVPREGVGVYFTNTYIPENEEETTKLEVQKQIAFPSGYELPATQDFTFVLELMGSAYAYEEYQITNLKTGLVEGTGTTDADGKFTLKGDQKATFNEILTDIDYQVTEEATVGWRVVGNTTLAGATKSPVTLASFTNANASFGVKKQMENNEVCEIDFTFVLTDFAKKPMVGIEYYLYSNSGERLHEDAAEPFVTDAQGKFTLQPGQTAIFIGLDLDTVFNVWEEVTEGFVQQLPSSADGYTDKKVSDAVEILLFVNKQKDVERTLNVTKRVVVKDENILTTDPSFTFVLEKKVIDEETSEVSYEPVKDAVYGIEVGGSESTYKTDKQGTFTLKRNETASFKALKEDEIYRVTEIDLPVGYTVDVVSKEGELTQSIYFTFDNSYDKNDYQLDLVIHKKNSSKDLLAGAKFKLYKDSELTDQVGTELETGASGEISFENLELGIYYLVETQSPEGYQLLSNPIKVELYDQGGNLAVKVNGNIYTTTDENKDIYLKLGGEDGGNDDEVHLTITNRRGFNLPLTGGSGIIIAAMVLLIGAELLSRSMFNIKPKMVKKKGNER